MTTTYKGELTKLNNNIIAWRKERDAFTSGDVVELKRLNLPEDKLHHKVERLRRDSRIETAKARILEITGRTRFNNPTPKSATGYDGNLPPGLANDPGDVPELKTCPHCNGDRVCPVVDGDLCGTCDGEGDVLPQVYAEYKAEVKDDQLANEA